MVVKLSRCVYVSACALFILLASVLGYLFREWLYLFFFLWMRLCFSGGL